MESRATNPLLEEFMATAEATARERPEVDRDLAREVFHEAATLLHDGLALDGLDEHDVRAVVAGLSRDLAAEDPGAAIRARAHRAASESEGLHDPEAVSRSCLIAASVLQL